MMTPKISAKLKHLASLSKPKTVKKKASKPSLAKRQRDRIRTHLQLVQDVFSDRPMIEKMLKGKSFSPKRVELYANLFLDFLNSDVPELLDCADQLAKSKSYLAFKIKRRKKK